MKSFSPICTSLPSLPFHVSTWVSSRVLRCFRNCHQTATVRCLGGEHILHDLLGFSLREAAIVDQGVLQRLLVLTAHEVFQQVLSRFACASSTVRTYHLGLLCSLCIGHFRAPLLIGSRPPTLNSITPIVVHHRVPLVNVVLTRQVVGFLSSPPTRVTSPVFGSRTSVIVRPSCSLLHPATGC